MWRYCGGIGKSFLLNAVCGADVFKHAFDLFSDTDCIDGRVFILYNIPGCGVRGARCGVRGAGALAALSIKRTTMKNKPNHNCFECKIKRLHNFCTLFKEVLIPAGARFFFPHLQDWRPTGSWYSSNGVLDGNAFSGLPNLASLPRPAGAPSR